MKQYQNNSLYKLINDTIMNYLIYVIDFLGHTLYLWAGFAMFVGLYYGFQYQNMYTVACQMAQT